MRIRIRANLKNSISVPINHQYALSSVIYNFLNKGDTDYTSELHQIDNAKLAHGNPRRFKLFCFSTLRSRERQVIGTSLRLGPGEMEWLVCSPVENFLQDFTHEILHQKHITLIDKDIFISRVETLPLPTLKSPATFSCLTPVVCSHPNTSRGNARFLTPADATFEESVRRNLIQKFTALHGCTPKDETLQWNWDEDYLKRGRGTKLIEYKSTFIKGAFAPFHLAGSAELIQLLYETGAGELNSKGFGMVEVQEK